MTMSRLAPKIALFAIATGAHAAVIQFGNEDATFVMIGSPGFAPGLFLDPTLPASQQTNSGQPERGILQVVVGGGGSETPNADHFSGGTNMLIARSNTPISVFNSSGVLFQFFPAQTLVAGDRVVNQDFQQSAASALFYVGGNRIHEPFLGQTPITAFRLELADGFHFGWVQWRFGPGQVLGGGDVFLYQPVRWAYETNPNTPITVPGVGTGSLFFSAAGILARRRRSMP